MIFVIMIAALVIFVWFGLAQLWAEDCLSLKSDFWVLIFGLPLLIILIVEWCFTKIKERFF